MCQWFSRRFIFRIKRADVKLLLGFSVPKPRIFLCVGAGLGQPIWFWDNAEKKSRREMECLGIISRVYGLYFCDELITRAEESCRLWCVVVCDLETSRMRRSWPALGRSATKKKGFILADRFQKSEIGNMSWNPVIFFCPVIRLPNLVTHGEGKWDAPDLSAEDGTVNTACSVERQDDEYWSKK